MKYRAIVEALVAGATVLALLAPASAMATELYSGVETVKKGTTVVMTLERETTFSTADTAGNPIDTCTVGTLEWEVANAGGATSTVNGPGSHMTFGGEGCNVTVDQAKNGMIEVHHIPGADDGTVTANGFHISIHVFGTTCTYGFGAATDLGVLTGSTSSTAVLDMNAIVTRVTGSFLCPSSQRWIARYVFTAPDPLHVTAS